ncbi:uncharacterized protein LOC126799978 [Argentina anserina]|uniref:uncharacterized protein LOC126799978 n=1 Tax=Argentina anserina TaxID=57926 RepID=UPI00217652B0|nr:uncharacterized protein LOC126799978 [Potentilla anserina]XP_050383199.1 uncharacterized protein LOC126799978 [Potentilla anserina]
MKRKRGHKIKKGKPKAAPSVPPSLAVVSLDDSAAGGDDSGMEVDTPEEDQLQEDQHYNLANISPDGSVGKGPEKSAGRVKVKLMTTPKAKESQAIASSQSDTEKSTLQMQDRMEDSGTSSGNVAKKAGSIKIKSSMSLGSSPVPAKSGSPPEKELHKPHSESRYIKQDLDTALTIIKKVMKMDAAEPFNVPVNPEALGIPDYFDVIDTPMDFGTICSNLELGVKYRNSEDVYKDVQYIWDNCCKYNSKGDYILDLMRRVKKNFSKYWMSAGLYSGQSAGTSGVESSQENISSSDQRKVHIGGQVKQKTRKSHGRRHKSDCLCAICVLKRRRREREENAQIAKNPLGASDINLSQEFRQEESSHAGSPGENSSSDMDGSLDPNADAKVEETEVVKMGVSEQRQKQDEEEDDDDEDEEESGTEMKDEGNGEGLQEIDKSREEPNEQLQPMISENLDAGMQTDTQMNTPAQHEEGIEADSQEKEAQQIRKKVKASENLQFENPMLVDLCGILFPKNSKSIWTGPHSLVQHRTSHTSSSLIHAAISVLMK